MAIGSFVSVFCKEKIHGLFAAMQGKHGLLGIVPACLLGIASPLCMYGTIPIAASFSRHGISDDWLADGMSMGSASAFMITGPATKITNLGALKIVLGAKHFALYIVFIMLYSLIIGCVMNLLVR